MRTSRAVSPSNSMALVKRSAKVTAAVEFELLLELLACRFLLPCSLPELPPCKDGAQEAERDPESLDDNNSDIVSSFEPIGEQLLVVGGVSGRGGDQAGRQFGEE